LPPDAGGYRTRLAARREQALSDWRRQALLDGGLAEKRAAVVRKNEILL
jgi:hypothetical protein